MKLEAFKQKSTVPPSTANIGKFFENSDEWLTTTEAAAYLKISEATLRNMCCNGSVLYYKLHRRNRFRLIDLRNLHKSKKGGFL